eukprot:g32177.t1
MLKSQGPRRSRGSNGYNIFTSSHQPLWRVLTMVMVLSYFEKQKGVLGFPGAERHHERHQAELSLSESCDFLIPAACEAQIDRTVANTLKAKVVVEAANLPCTAQGSESLFARGIPVLPDILCNAGGVVVGYFEWIK